MSDYPEQPPLTPTYQTAREEPYNMRQPIARGAYSGMPPRESMKPLNGNAIISFCLMLFWFSIPAIIVGHVALYQLSFTGFERGRGLARFGVVLGYIQVLAAVALFLFVGIHVVAGIAATVAAFQIAQESGAGASDGVNQLLQLLGDGSATPTPSGGSDAQYDELMKELEKLASQ